METQNTLFGPFAEQNLEEIRSKEFLLQTPTNQD